MTEMTPHSINMQVRDYELDTQQVVNNAHYFNYFEHARHQFLLHKGLDFNALQDQGYYLMLKETTLNYKRSLRANQHFAIQTTCEQRSPLRLLCHQSLLVESEAYVDAVAIVICLKQPEAKLCMPEFIKTFLFAD